MTTMPIKIENRKKGNPKNILQERPMTSLGMKMNENERKLMREYWKKLKKKRVSFRKEFGDW